MMSDFEDGAIAALDGQDECTNPHSSASPAYGEWQDGWHAAASPCKIREPIVLPAVDDLQESLAHVVIH